MKHIEPEFTPSRSISIFEAIDEYLTEKEAIGALSDTSIHNRRYELNRFASFCKLKEVENPAGISKQLLVSYLKLHKVKKASKVSIIYVLAGFMDFLVDAELMLDNIAASLEKPKIYQPKTDYLTIEEIERVFRGEAEHGSPKAVDRNLLLFSLFTDICLRVSEVVNLTLADVRLDNREIWITRKRNKVDKIPLNDYTVHNFQRWYAMRPKYKGSSQMDWVFLSSHGKQLNRRQVHDIVSKSLRRAGIIKRKQGPHLLRHSGASLKARAGENLIMIQYLLGHESLNTTRRYLHFNWEELREMVDRGPRLGPEPAKRPASAPKPIDPAMITEPVPRPDRPGSAAPPASGLWPDPKDEVDPSEATIPH